MQLYSLRKVVTAFVVAILVTTLFAAFTNARGFAAPVSQEIRAQEVSGILPGGEFSKIWLGLEPETAGAQITIISEWDTPNPADRGLNFFILDDQGLQRIGSDSLSTIALGAGSANFVLNGPDNFLGASFNAAGLGPYTLVIANDSNQDANFTLRITNGFVVDDSNQVTDLNAAPVTDEAATDEADTDEAATDEAAAETPTTTDTDATTGVVATATPAPAATTSTTTVTTTTTAVTDTTVTDTAPTTTTVAGTATQETPAAVGTGGTVRATSLSGNLPNQNDQHFLGLEPSGRDVQVTLNLTIEPQDDSELARRLNFWVLDSTGFNQFLAGSDPSDVAIAAGNRVFRGLDNERVASFRVVGTGSYTVIVYNTATVPGNYTLETENGLLIDDSGQTNESIAGGGTALGATGATTGTVAADGTITTTTPAATTATTTTATREGTPGGSYTVQSGDTLALIARDIYGDFNLYQELCAFNEIANCNVIEVGDVVQLPTQAQISAGIATTTAAPAATPAPTTAPTTAQTDAADEEESTTDAVEATATPAVTATEPVTDTAATETTDETAATEDETSAAGATIFQTLVDNGNFTTLVSGLEGTGLDATLDSAGGYTLFAPTDAAFVALRNRFSLSEEQLLSLPELADVLRYHVLNGTVLSDDISDGTTAATLQGNDVNFVVDGDTIRINNAATLIATDVETANGVIHVIEAVILPPN